MKKKGKNKWMGFRYYIKTYDNLITPKNKAINQEVDIKY